MMTKKEFRDECISKGPPIKGLSIEAIKEALKAYTRDERFYDHGETETIYRLAEVLQEKENEKKTENKNLKIINITPQVQITSEYLSEKITPWVESVRQEIFNQTIPPFKDINESIIWIAEKEKEAYTDKERKKKEALLLKKFDEAVILARDLKIPWSISDPRGGPFITYHPYLNKLQSEARRMSNATGFKEYDLILFILTGKKPILQAVKMTWKNKAESSLPTGEMLKRFYVSFDINTCDLTFNELKAMYNAYRKELRITKGKSLKENHLKLYRYVRGMGGPPEIEKVAFWKKVAKKFKYKEWKLAYTAYKRIEKRLLKQSHTS